MIQRISFVLLALGLVAGASAARAQQRPITGKVVGAGTSEPVVGASVTVVGTPVSAVTNAQGEFSLSGPGGPVSLLVRSVGYTHRQVSVAADQSTITVSLAQDVFNLEAVVVTGQATGVEQRNLANAVTTVNADQLNRAPTETIESALQGKIPGAVIQMNSGAPGGGGQINLRGVTTINAGVDPLIVVDGMVIANDAIASNMNAITAAAAGGNASNQDNPVNRIADLNPDDIASINVLKGASAAAIYGSQAANGVLIINTRRGQAGAPRFSVTQRVGTSGVLSNLTSRVFADSVAADAAFGGGAQAYCKLPGGKCPYYDNSGVLYGNHPLSVETDASVTGGNDQTTYYISGLIKKDGAIATNTDYQKQGVRANVDQVLGPRFKISINLNAIHSLSDRGISNNDNTGTSPFLVFPSTPSFINLSATCDPTRTTCYPLNPFAPSNPLQTMAILKNAEDVWRIMNTSTLNVDAVTTATQHLRFTVTGGIDYFSQRNDILSPADLQYEPQDGFPGTVVLGKASDLRENMVGSVVHTYTPPSNAFQATTSAGFQYENRDLNITNIVGRTIGLGLQNVNQAAFVSSNQSEQPVRNLGIYAQEEVIALEQKLLLTVGARADRSSLNGDPSHYFFYPKAAASYRFVQPMGGVDEVKARLAWGQTGNPPLFYYRGTLDSTSAVGGLVGQYRALQLGDASITPERNTELEGGIDATFGNQFATLGVTVYQKTISDLLLQESVAPSTGYQFRVFNGGRLRNRGVEASLAVSPVRNPDVNWVLRSTFYLNRSLVETLPVPAFNTGGFGTSLGAYRIEVGQSATQIVGTEGVVGDANPNFQMSFASDLTYKRLSFGFLWDWKSGGDVINLTQLLYDAAGNSPDQVPAGNTRISTWAGGKTAVYVQSGTYLKLRELTLGYDVPAEIPGHFGMRTMRISLSGRNLLKFSPYQGLDPEVSNFGNQPIARNIDVAPYPPSRTFFFSVDFGF